MKVRILQCLRGPGVKLNPGDTHECDPVEAERLINKGIAEPVKRGRRRKTVLEPAEKAVIE